MNESFSGKESTPPPQSARLELPPVVPYVTYAILGFTVLVYILQRVSVATLGYAVYEIDWLEVYGARFNEAIRMGEWWRLVTPVFLHGSVLHIFLNMYALFSLGSSLERHFGRGRFALLYFLGAFSGNVFSIMLGSENGYSIGASTAVFGLVGAQLVFLYQNRRLFGGQARKAIEGTVFIIAANLLIGLIPGLDPWGNVGGLLGGAMFAWFAGPCWEVVGIVPEFRLEDQRESREIIVAMVTTLAVFGAIAFWKLYSG